MTNRPSPKGARSGRPGLRAWTLALALAGCGGGVDSGGTGSPTYASGSITGFGSVVVNGVHFDDGAARVTDGDGTLRSRDDLRLGMTTEIRGSAIATDASGTPVSAASSITFGSDLLAPIDSIDVPAGQLVVFGQTVDTDAATVFDDVSVSGGLAALAAGDVVEVYALLDAASGHYLATRIERKASATTLVLRGVVSQFDPSARRFGLGGVQVSYAGFSGTLPPGLGNGSIVRVRLLAAPVAGVWQIGALNNGADAPSDRDEVRLDGLVSALTSASRFSVNGVAVDVSAVNTTGVAAGVRVEVEGTLRAGVLVASKLQVKTAGGAAGQDFELRGPIASPDAATSSFVIRGVTVVYASATTEFKDGTPAGLVSGVNVEVRGKLASNGTQLLATRITFK